MTMGHIQESVRSEDVDRDLRRFTEIAQSLAAGNKLTLDVLQWYIDFAEQHWFFAGITNTWRNKSTNTLYTFEGVTLRITDSEVSPVYLWVDYSPVENHFVKFSREANEFLRKFEPVREVNSWQAIDAQPSRLPGAMV